MPPDPLRGYRLWPAFIQTPLHQILDPPQKLSLLHTLFLENEVQINKTNYATMLFMSKQVSLPKISAQSCENEN